VNWSPSLLVWIHDSSFAVRWITNRFSTPNTGRKSTPSSRYRIFTLTSLTEVSSTSMVSKICVVRRSKGYYSINYELFVVH
jgi:hypothetical protein